MKTSISGSISLPIWMGVGLCTLLSRAFSAPLWAPQGNAGKVRSVLPPPPAPSAVHLETGAMALLRRTARLYGGAHTWRANVYATRPNRRKADFYRVVFARPRKLRVQVTLDGERILRISDGRHLRLVEMNAIENPHTPLWNRTPISREIRGLLMGGGIPGVGSQMGDFLAGRTGLEGDALKLKLGGASGLWARQLPPAFWNGKQLCQRVQVEIHYIARRDGEPIRSRETWWLAPADGRLVGAEYHLISRGNRPFYERGSLGAQEWNAPLPPDTFRFVLPPHAKHE